MTPFSRIVLGLGLLVSGAATGWTVASRTKADETPFVHAAVRSRALIDRVVQVQRHRVVTADPDDVRPVLLGRHQGHAPYREPVDRRFPVDQLVRRQARLWKASAKPLRR